MSDPNIPEAEIVQTQALAIREPQSVSLFRTDDPVEVVRKASAVASALKDVISKQGLISNIKGKEYPKCEAWTLCGTMLGVFPVLTWTRQLSDGWEARVEAKTRDGAIVGAAEAQCNRSERNWENRDDFALRSMAQTRATAKALRMPLGFIMSLAGFQPTPAEEMPKDDSDHHNPPPPPSKRPTEANRAKFPKPERTIPKREDPIGTEAQRDRMIKELSTLGLVEAAWNWFVAKGMLKDNERLDQLPLEFVPTTVAQFNEYKILIERSQPSDNDGDLGPQEPQEPEEDGWREFPLPFPGQKGAIAKGTPLGELDGKYAFGLFMNYTVETEYNGKPLKQEQIDKSTAFREALDAMGAHRGWEKS